MCSILDWKLHAQCGAKCWTISLILPQITMKRRSSLYVANFLMPVLFFLCLDLSSLLMTNTAEKIGFKISVMLAVTVMQLLLNDILPVSSNNIPLIGKIQGGSPPQHTTAPCVAKSATKQWVNRTHWFIIRTNDVLSAPLSDLLHRDFCSDEGQPAGDHFGEVSDG